MFDTISASATNLSIDKVLCQIFILSMVSTSEIIADMQKFLSASEKLLGMLVRNTELHRF